MDNSSNLPNLSDSNTILRPVGRQSGQQSSIPLLKVRRFTREPSIRIFQISMSPLRELMNTIDRPDGDQLGYRLPPRIPLVRFRRFEPSARATHRS